MNKSLSEKIENMQAGYEGAHTCDIKTFIKKLNIWWHSDDDQRSMKEFLKDEAGSDLL